MNAGTSSSELSLYCQGQDAGRDQENAYPFTQSWTLAKEHDCKESDKHHAEFVYRSDFRCVSDLKRPEVANPRSASGEARQCSYVGT
jgi:hypothetical protein